jgi:hypothetical protein
MASSSTPIVRAACPDVTPKTAEKFGTPGTKGTKPFLTQSKEALQIPIF